MSLLMLCAARSRKNHRGGTLWTPANLTTPPALWLNNTSTVTNDGTGHCSNWSDISGNGYDYGQTASNQRPAITSAGLNGLRTITFDGSNDNLVSNISTNNLATNVAALSYFVLANPVPTSSTARIANWSVGTSTGGSGSSARAAIYVGTAGANTVSAYQRKPDSGSAVAATHTGYSTQAWHLWEAEHNWGAATVAIRMDGNTATTTNTGQTAGNSDNSQSNVVEIGGDTASGQVINGSIAEMIALGYIPGTSDRQKIEGYVMWKWGLQANLPPGHPYQSAPPYV